MGQQISRAANSPASPAGRRWRRGLFRRARAEPELGRQLLASPSRSRPTPSRRRGPRARAPVLEPSTPRAAVARAGQQAPSNNRSGCPRAARAPGCGSQPRIRRSSSSAAAPVDRAAVVREPLRRRARLVLARPRRARRHRGDRLGDGFDAERIQPLEIELPAVSVSRIDAAFLDDDRAGSTPASGRNTVTPLAFAEDDLPRERGAPRKRGSSEGWKHSEPWRGASTISGGRIVVTNASTLSSAPSARCSATSSGSAAPPRGGSGDGEQRGPRAAASLASGSGRLVRAERRRRPAGAAPSRRTSTSLPKAA